MSNIEAVKSSTDVDIQSDIEIMMHVFEDFRENRPILSEECDVASFQLHRWYKSLPNISFLSISAGEALLSKTQLMNQVFNDIC